MEALEILRSNAPGTFSLVLTVRLVSQPGICTGSYPWMFFFC